MDKEQKERLEQELRFLKESLEADVISRDEYERGKERIERKLKEIELKEEEPKEPEKEEIKEESKIEIKELKEKPTKIIGAEEEKPEEEKEEEKKEEQVVEEKKEEEVIEEKKPTEEEPEEEQKIKDFPTSESEDSEEIKISKKWLYGIAIIIIAIILFFAMRGCKTEEEKLMEESVEEPIEEELIEEFIPECSSDSDCKKEGMLGICLNPGTKEAECQFKEDIKTNLILINDKDCKLCDSSSMKRIIKKIFPNVEIKEIDYGTEEAKKLIGELDINTLPSYIFDSEVSKAINFEDFKSALIKKENNYIITNTASGASYYFERPLIENKLDLYILPETTEKIEASIQEVSDLFKDKINLTKHTVTERQKENLEKELGINTYPAFLLNNQLIFRGILPADIIRQRICDVNYFEECSKELPKV